MKPDKWIYMPHPGHFICSKDCRFFLNTYVGKYIVSTVGEMWPERAVREIHAQVHDFKWLNENKHLKGDYFDSAYMNRFGYEQIGCDRLYETMVFKAKKSDHKCCPWVQINGDSIDFNGYNKPEDALKGHIELCKKWSERIV